MSILTPSRISALSPFLVVVAVGLVLRVASFGTHTSPPDFKVNVASFEVQPMMEAAFGRRGTRVVVDFTAEGHAPDWWDRPAAKVARTHSGDLLLVRGRMPICHEADAERIGPEFVRPGVWRVEYRFKKENLHQHPERLRLRNILRFPSPQAEASQSIVVDLPLNYEGH